ncbi:hypothetical protein L7F22_032482 [Adiantum nelumboides]|nr:hypothetical protein [Adiantum nelumboides]
MSQFLGRGRDGCDDRRGRRGQVRRPAGRRDPRRRRMGAVGRGHRARARHHRVDPLHDDRPPRGRAGVGVRGLVDAGRTADGLGGERCAAGAAHPRRPRPDDAARLLRDVRRQPVRDAGDPAPDLEQARRARHRPGRDRADHVDRARPARAVGDRGQPARRSGRGARSRHVPQTRHRDRHRRRRPDLLRPAVPHRLRRPSGSRHSRPAQPAEVPAALAATDGVAMELEDCAFPLLRSVEITDDPMVAFDGCSVGLLVGARPRARAWNGRTCSRPTAPSSVPRGPRSTPSPPTTCVSLSSGTRPTPTHSSPERTPRTSRRPLHLDDAARPQPGGGTAGRASRVGSGEVRRMAVWGNHSSTQYPDLTHAEVDGAGVVDRLDPTWVRKDFIPTVAGRGSAIIDARGASSAGVCRQRRGRPGP